MLPWSGEFLILKEGPVCQTKGSKRNIPGQLWKVKASYIHRLHVGRVAAIFYRSHSCISIEFIQRVFFVVLRQSAIS